MHAPNKVDNVVLSLLPFNSSLYLLSHTHLYVWRNPKKEFKVWHVTKARQYTTSTFTFLIRDFKKCQTFLCCLPLIILLYIYIYIIDRCFEFYQIKVFSPPTFLWFSFLLKLQVHENQQQGVVAISKGGQRKMVTSLFHFFFFSFFLSGETNKQFWFWRMHVRYERKRENKKKVFIYNIYVCISFFFFVGRVYFSPLKWTPFLLNSLLFWNHSSHPEASKCCSSGHDGPFRALSTLGFPFYRSYKRFILQAHTFWPHKTFPNCPQLFSS